MNYEDLLEKKCPCGRGFTANRLNQIYHNTKCKERQNNLKAKNERETLNPSNYAKRRSMRILNIMLEEGTKEVGREELEKRGVGLTLPEKRLYVTGTSDVALIFYNVRLIPTDKSNFKIERHDTIK